MFGFGNALAGFAIVVIILPVFIGFVTRHLLGMPVGWVRIVGVYLLVFIPTGPITGWVIDRTGAAGTGTGAVFIVVPVALGWAFAISVAVLVVLEAVWPTAVLPNPIAVIRGWVMQRKRTRRYLQILTIASRHGLGWLFHGKARVDSSLTTVQQRAEALVHTINASGVTFVKLGQVLSTRRDLMPEPYLSALATLQSSASTIPWQAVRGVMESELGRPLETVFSQVDEAPLAAASVAQVHAATLLDGTEVVVKVQRPSARAQVEADVDILLRLARRAELHTRQGREMRAEAIARGFTTTLLEELDYRVESGNTEMVRSTLALAMVKDTEAVPIVIPTIHAAASTARMITMDRVDGVPLSAAADRLSRMAPDARNRLADGLMNAVLEQILVHGVFHADLHPGNVILRGDGSLALIDFGAVGVIERSKREQVAALLLAVASEDDISATEALLLIVDALQDIDTDALRHDLGVAITAVRHQPDADASIFTVALDVARQHRIALPATLASAFRSFATLEGCLRVLVPDFSMMDRSLERVPVLMRRLASVRHLAASAQAQAAVVGALARRMPRRIESITSQLERGTFGVRLHSFATTGDRSFVSALLSEVLGVLVSLTVGVIAVVLVIHGGGPDLAPNLPVFPLGGSVLGLFAFLGVLRSLLRASRLATAPSGRD
jgi:ubiquinone biosynthesis protein